MRSAIQRGCFVVFLGLQSLSLLPAGGSMSAAARDAARRARQRRRWAPRRRGRPERSVPDIGTVGLFFLRRTKRALEMFMKMGIG